MKTGNCEPIICSLMNNNPNVAKQSTIKRWVASCDQPLVEIFDVFPLKIALKKCFKSLKCICNKKNEMENEK